MLPSVGEKGASAKAKPPLVKKLKSKAVIGAPVMFPKTSVEQLIVPSSCCQPQCTGLASVAPMFGANVNDWKPLYAIVPVPPSIPILGSRGILSASATPASNNDITATAKALPSFIRSSGRPVCEGFQSQECTPGASQSKLTEEILFML